MEKRKKVYLIIFIIVLFISIIGGTFAYFTTMFSGDQSSVRASSSNYSLNMEIIPIYNDFRIIPMDDTDVITALNNNCKDKYDRGACSVYKINLSDYDTSSGLLTGSLNVTLNNIENLSYMVFEKKEEIIDNNTCVTIDEEIYCISKEATAVVNENELPLGSYDVTNTTDKQFLLVLWLTNLDRSQNETDLGDYNAAVTFTMGDGIIKGNISAAINNEEILQSQSGD